jgi:hypothetical protein
MARRSTRAEADRLACAVRDAARHRSAGRARLPQFDTSPFLIVMHLSISLCRQTKFPSKDCRVSEFTI